MYAYFLAVAALNIALAIRQLKRIGLPYRDFFLSLTVSTLALAVVLEAGCWIFLVNKIPVVLLLLIQAILIGLTTEWWLVEMLKFRLHRVTNRLQKMYNLEVKSDLIYDEENAFATYDKDNRPLILFCVAFANQHKALLTFLVGHELAHLGLGHVQERMQRAQSLDSSQQRRGIANFLPTALLGIPVWHFLNFFNPGLSVIAGALTTITKKGIDNWMNSGYNHSQEYQADAAGIVATMESGYSEELAVKLFSGWAAQEPQRGWFRRHINKLIREETHPASQERAEHAQQVAQHFRLHGPEATRKKYVTN
ncbi:MAG: M48 family metalloprotease [Ignavibacteriales bacterium]|nr:M48 family metalloprotease [Ignavibacteriales bacterium]